MATYGFHTANGPGFTRLEWSPNPVENSVVVAGQTAPVDTTDTTVLFEELPAPPEFQRGDVTANGSIGLADGISLLNYLFVQGTPPPSCIDTADINDDGGVGLVDGIQLLNYLFSAGPQPEPPTDCGQDPTDDALSCEEFGPCL